MSSRSRREYYKLAVRTHTDAGSHLRSWQQPPAPQPPAPQSVPPQPLAPQPPIEKQSAPAQINPSKKKETDFAIELAAQELRENRNLTRDELFERLFGSEDKRAPPLKERVWVTPWTPSRLRRKVWKRARERAGLDPLALPGRRPEK